VEDVAEGFNLVARAAVADSSALLLV